MTEELTGTPQGDTGDGQSPVRGGVQGGRPPRGTWRAVFFGLATLGIVVGVGWALLGSKLLVVRSVEVTGTHLVTPRAVLAAADVPDGTPLLRVDTTAVERRVESIRDVASARVTKSWPNKLVIAIQERIAVVAVRMSGGGYDLLDRTGVIVRWAESKPAALPEYLTSQPGNALRGNPGLASAASVLTALPGWLLNSVDGVSAPDPGQVTLRLRNRVTVVWGSDTRNEQKANELGILMKQAHARYYDVSARGTVVTR